MDSTTLDLLINFGIPAALIVFAFFIGSLVERRHFGRIRKREDDLREIMAFAIRRAPQDLALSEPKLVCGSAVISVDYFKKFAADLRGIVGGRIGTYESLFERARREALVRMKAEAKDLGGNIVLNVKLETARIYAGGRSAVSVEAVAYGTAFSMQNAGSDLH